MNPTVKLDRALVAVDIDQTVHMMLELTAPPAPTTDRAPIDVVAVIDRSGSMSGEPLESVVRAVQHLIRLLGPDDQLGVVTFDDSAELILPLAHHDIGQVGHLLARIRPGGSTNLSGGWLKGLEILSAHGRDEALKRVVVLTDGHANCGITDTETLCTLASAANRQTITTSMIGFGDGFDERVLASMADAGGGNDYWCAGPDQASQVFAAEFDGLAAVVAQNISVDLLPTGAIDGWLVLNEYPMVAIDGGMQIALGDAYGGENRRVVAMLHLQAPREIGVVHAADLVIRWASTIGDIGLHSVTVPVMVGAADPADADAVTPDPEVSTQVNVLRVARARKDSHEAVDRGDLTAASEHLKSALALCDAAGMEAHDIEQLVQDVERLARGDWDTTDSKRLHSQLRSTSKGRRTRYDGGI